MPTGKTKTAGWEMGLRKTFNASPEHAWQILFSDSGLKLWLGTAPAGFKKGQPYNTAGNKVKSYTKGSLVRLGWQAEGLVQESTLQLRVLKAASNKATVAFHQEKLSNEAERKAMLKHWNQVMEKLTTLLEAAG